MITTTNAKGMRMNKLQTVVSRMSKDGSKSLKITVRQDGQGVSIDTFINDRKTGSFFLLPRTGRLPANLLALGYVAEIGGIVVDRAEYQSLELAIAEIKASIVPVPLSLPSQREAHVAKLESALSESDFESTKAWEREDTNGAFARDARVEVARKALDDFDAAHPEIIASIRAEKAAAVARFVD